jgi:hypothetical protein
MTHDYETDPDYLYQEFLIDCLGAMLPLIDCAIDDCQVPNFKSAQFNLMKASCYLKQAVGCLVDLKSISAGGKNG